MISFILNYCIAPFFIGAGLYVVIRSSMVLRKREFKTGPYSDARRNWHFVSVFVGATTIVLGILILFRIFSI